MNHYFFLIGLNAFLRHFLHLTFPSNIFLGSALNFALQFLHTNIFLNNLACVAGNFVAMLNFFEISDRELLKQLSVSQKHCL